jgi:hypothetical protein
MERGPVGTLCERGIEVVRLRAPAGTLELFGEKATSAGREGRWLGGAG